MCASANVQKPLRESFQWSNLKPAQGPTFVILKTPCDYTCKMGTKFMLIVNFQPIQDARKEAEKKNILHYWLCERNSPEGRLTPAWFSAQCFQWRNEGKGG